MKKASILMILGSALLLGLFYFPLWSIELKAPQYPEGLGMNIHINSIKGVEEFDIQNINGLNHYIGMKTIPEVDEMREFTIFPIVIGGMAAIGILLGIIGFFGKLKPQFYLFWLITISVLGLIGMYDFNNWLMDYGTNLAPNAPIQLLNEFGDPMNYKPPLIGHKKLLNFDVTSLPGIGAYLMFLGLGLVFVSFIIGRKAKNRNYEKYNINPRNVSHSTVV